MPIYDNSSQHGYQYSMVQYGTVHGMLSSHHPVKKEASGINFRKLAVIHYIMIGA